jgi:hypothetical protein
MNNSYKLQLSFLVLQVLTYVLVLKIHRTLITLELDFLFDPEDMKSAQIKYSCEGQGAVRAIPLFEFNDVSLS